VPATRAHTRAGRASLDLPRGVAAQLEAAGVRDVRRVGGCTRCEPGWFSHRGALAGAMAPGRHAGIIVRRQGAEARR